MTSDGTGCFTRHVPIPVMVELDHRGVYVATSPLVPGLLAVSKNQRVLFERVDQAMVDLTNATLRATEPVNGE
jgi:hypothetical protein